MSFSYFVVVLVVINNFEEKYSLNRHSIEIRISSYTVKGVQDTYVALNLKQLICNNMLF